MNGAGVTGVFPPLAGSEHVTGDAGTLVRIILNGLTGPVEVKDHTYNGVMPPWGSALKDDEIAALTTYIRSSWGNKAAAISVEDVAKVRAVTKDRKQPWTLEELNKDENKGIPSAK
jgi:mono/diheme cytochrome c family protein